jgi:RNA polymerase sigma-70 factor (ECF subfamily)
MGANGISFETLVGAVPGVGPGTSAATSALAALAALPDETDDVLLVGALVGQHPDAPRLLWRRFAPMVFRMLRRTLGRDDEIEDLVQDVFLCVFQKAHTLRRPRALKAFIISVTVLTSRQELRRRWARRRLPATEDPPGVEAESITGRSDAREALLRFYRILDRLRPTDRAVFVLRFMEALPLEDVSAALDISLATTKRRLARGRSKIELLVARDPFLANYLAGFGAAPRRARAAEGEA